MSAQPARRLVDVEPTHILAPQGQGSLKPWGGTLAKPRSLCGIKNPLPIVRPEFVAAHVAGHGMVVCPACQRQSDGGGARNGADT